MLEALNKVSKAFNEPQKAAEKFAVATANIGKTAASAGKAAEKSAGGMSKFASSIARIAKYRLIRAVIRGIVDAVKEGAENFYNFSKASNDSLIGYSTAVDKVKSAAQIMKNQVGSAFGSLYAAIAPIILKLIEIATKLANVFTMLFAKLGGADGWYRAKEGADAAADSAAGAGKAAKEAMKDLAPFDELNRLPSNNNDNGGGGTSTSSSGGGGYEWVPFDKFDIADGIKEIFDWIKDAFNNISDWIENVDWLHLASNIVGWISDAFSKVDWAGVTQSIARFLGSAIGAVSAFVVGALIDLTQWITDKLTELFVNEDGTQKTGKEIVTGIYEGIKNAVVNVYTWLKDNVFDPFITAFKKCFGIASPAKEMEEPGEMIGQGILAGIAAPFKAIGAWIKDNILDPIKKVFDGETGFEFPFKITLPEGVLKTLEKIKTIWNSFKSKKPTLTPVLKGWSDAKQKALDKLKSTWANISSKTADLTANLKQGFKTNVLEKLSEVWTSIKDVKVSLEAKLSASTLVQSFITKWNNLVSKTLELKIGIQEKLKEAWNKAAAAWNKSAILSALGTLPYLAGGGMVNAGQVFIARESGPEIVGQYGNKTGVMNNQQIVEAVSRGVANAIASIKFTLTNIPSITGFGGGMDEETMYRAMVRALTDSNIGDNETVVNLDGNVLYRAMVRRNRMNTAATGVNAMA